MMTFLRSRFFLLIPLGLTVAAFYGLFSRQTYDAAWMLQWNHIDIMQLQQVYGVLIGVLLLALPFAPRLQAALRRGRVGVVILALVVSFLCISLLEPVQEHRLFITPFSVWIIIAHILSCTGVVLRFSLSAAPGHSLRRFLATALGLVLVLLVVLHIFSLTEYMAFDLPDEPFNASIATNYAQYNDLSSQYIGSAYGSPDVVFPRYYWVMGVWLKMVGSISLAALRSFPVLVAAAALVLFCAALWHTRRRVGQTGWYVLLGAVVLLTLSPFMRTAHNLRMDILLVVYGSLMLWGMLGFWGLAEHALKYLLLMGFALFLGMQAVPLAAVPLSFSTGLLLIVWWGFQTEKRRYGLYIITYAAACALGITAYYLLQFLPNLSESWERYRAFVQSYTALTGVGGLRLPLDALVSYIGRFSFILSPAELMVSGFAFVALWRMNSAADRWLVASVGLAFVIVVLFSRLSYSYMAAFTPFMAYAVARLLPAAPAAEDRLRWAVLLVAVPALVAVPVFDLTTALQTRPNQMRLEAAAPLQTLVPEGSVVVGEDIYWFSLNDRRTYIGINGIINYVSIRGVSFRDALNALNVDTLLCDPNSANCGLLVETGYFTEATSVSLGDEVTVLHYARATS